jgi:TMEM175 potassium channel family protein
MRGRWETTRTEAFGDGVFAIAITLLVLDIAVPESELGHFWHAVVRQWPAYLAYATSFITIGGLWLGHHAVFRRLACINTAVTRLNLALLMATSFLPFPTRLVGQALTHPESVERGAVIFYGGWLLLTSILFSALWRTVARNRELLRPEVTEAEIDAIGRATTPSVAFYAAMTAFALLAPRAAAFGYLVVAIVSLARIRDDVRAPQSA